MRRLLFRVWNLPWPPVVRRFADRLVRTMWIQRLVVPGFLVGVVGVIVNDQNEVLLLRHTYRHGYPWGLPSGFLERGEQPARALIREIREEAGLEVELTELWRVQTDRDGPLVSIVYRGRYRGGDFTPSLEVSEARFYALGSLPPMLDEQRALIEAALAGKVPDAAPDGVGSQLF